jgi:hypothetical protein
MFLLLLGRVSANVSVGRVCVRVCAGRGRLRASDDHDSSLCVSLIVRVLARLTLM